MNIIFKSIFGSKLYGTNTSDSDDDFKSIFLPAIKDLILNKIKLDSSINESNKEDKNCRSTNGIIEIEHLPLHKFLHLCEECQTMAIDILYTPKDKILICDDKFKRLILDNKNMFLSKNLITFIRYCKQQANKYGIKGSRVNTVRKYIDVLLTKDPDIILNDCIEELKPLLDEHSFIVESDKLHECILNICGKKFLYTTKIKYIIPSLNKFDNEFGLRAKMAATNEGVDFKALSHFARACFEVKEIVNTRNLVFPLKDREYITNIKIGKIPYIELAPYLEDLLIETEELLNNSDLPDKPSVNINDLILEMYNI